MHKKRGGGKGKKKKKSRKQLVEYDQNDREDSLEIDGTSVFFNSLFCPLFLTLFSVSF